MGCKGKAIVFLALVLTALPLPARDSGQRDSLVRLISAKTIELIEKGGRNYRKSVDATFLHNGTYLVCDTALWNVEDKVINAEGHVKLIQEGTILTSEKMDYFVDDDLVQCRGGVVQLEDSQHNTLRTRFLDYNTKDSLAFFSRGGSMRDSEGQIIESDDGSYDARAELFTFRGNVNMFTDSIFIKTSLLEYESTPNRANFLEPIDFWKDGNMLSASRGWYLRPAETFFFTGSVHATSEQQEAWCDSLYYYRTPNDLLMLGNAQVQDTTRDVAALANRIHYMDSLSQVTLSDDAAVALITKEEEALLDSLGNPIGVRTRRDTLYMGADKMVYRTIPFCLIPPGDTLAAKERKADMLTDPVLEYRQKAAKAAAEAAAKAAQEAAEREGRPVIAGSEAPSARPAADTTAVIDRQPQTPGQSGGDALPTTDNTAVSNPSDTTAVSAAPDTTAVSAVPDRQSAPSDSLSSVLLSASEEPADSLSITAGSLAVASDTTAVIAVPGSDRAPADTLAGAATLPAPADSLAAPSDTLTAPADTLLPPQDSTKIGFLDAVGNIRIFREDIQIRCDSLRYNDLDSIARLYIDPIVWNDGNRQYNADSLFALVIGNSVDRVALESNAFVITQETPALFDQIKATEIMAYFDSTAALRRFDGLGGTNAIFFLKEKERIGTVNKVETKMMSAIFKDGDIDRIYYFDSPKNDVYPLAQLKPADRELKGFTWKPELRPRGRHDITTLEVRPSERAIYDSHPRATFKQTDIYFPGYMKGVYQAIEDAKNRPASRPAPGPTVADTTAVSAPSDSLVVLPGSDSLAVMPGSDRASADSLSQNSKPDGAETLPAQADTLAAGTDTLATRPLTKAEIRAQKKAEAERRRAERIAQREARWAELDSLDAAKAAAKAARKEARDKARLAKQLERQRKQDLADEAKLAKYIEQYRAQKAREEAWAAAKAAKAEAKAARAAEKAAKAAAKASTKSVPVLPDGDSTADTSAVSTPSDNPSSVLLSASEESADTTETTKPAIENGTDTRPLPPLHSGGHPKQRRLPDPALDPKTAESSETALQGAE